MIDPGLLRVLSTLRFRAVQKRRLARQQPDQDSPAAAALRGQALGLSNAADLIGALMHRRLPHD